MYSPCFSLGQSQSHRFVFTYCPMLSNLIPMLRVSSLRNKRCLPNSVLHGLDLLSDVDDVSQLIGDLTVVLSLPRHGTTKIHRTRRLKQKSDSGVRKCHFFYQPRSLRQATWSWDGLDCYSCCSSGDILAFGLYF